MRTTIDINDELMMLARKRAAEERTSVKAIVERALRSLLQGPKNVASYRLQWRTEQGQVQPGVDLANRDALLDLMDQS